MSSDVQIATRKPTKKNPSPAQSLFANPRLGFICSGPGIWEKGGLIAVGKRQSVQWGESFVWAAKSPLPAWQE